MQMSKKISDFFGKRRPVTETAAQAEVVSDETDDNDTETTDSPTPTTKRPRIQIRKFSPLWLKNFAWLRYNEAEDLMFCFQCRKTDRRGVWSDGTRNFRLKTLKVHALSEEHRFAVNSEMQPTIAEGNVKRKKAFLLALKAVFWLAKEEISNIKYKSLLNFLQQLGVQDSQVLNHAGNAQYNSPGIFNQLLSSLDFVVQSCMKKQLRNSPFIAVGIDESTDRSQEKHIAVVVRFINQSYEVETTFLKLRSIKDGTAVSILGSLSEILQEFDVPYSKVAGLGADGVNVMSSTLNGLTGLVQVKNPFCVYIHCVCHRLALALSNCQTSIPSLTSLSKIIASVYNYVQYSKLERFKDIAEILQCETLKFKRIFDIRWLSLGEAVIAVLRNYEPLMVLVSQDAREGDPVAIGINQQFSSYKYVALLHLIADVLGILNHLSRIFQHNDIGFSVVRLQLQDSIETLDSLARDDGPYMASLKNSLTPENMFKGVTLKTDGRRGEPNQKELYEQWRQELVATLSNNIKTRFPKVDLLDAMKIFEPAAYPTDSTLVGWGNDDLDLLLKHYGASKTNREDEVFNELVDPDGARGEFLAFKRVVARNRGTGGQGQQFHSYRPTELMQILFSKDEHRVLFPEMFKLMNLAVCVLVGNSEAERVFSCQNRIKSRLRTRLTVKHLDQLIRISYSNKTSFPFDEALDHFLRQSRRL